MEAFIISHRDLQEKLNSNAQSLNVLFSLTKPPFCICGRLYERNLIHMIRIAYRFSFKWTEVEEMVYI